MVLKIEIGKPTIGEMKSIVKKVDIEHFLDLVAVLSSLGVANEDWHTHFTVRDLYMLHSLYKDSPVVMNIDISDSFAGLLLRCFEAARKGELCLCVGKEEITKEVHDFVKRCVTNKHTFLDFYDDKCNIIW